MGSTFRKELLLSLVGPRERPPTVHPRSITLTEVWVCPRKRDGSLQGCSNSLPQGMPASQGMSFRFHLLSVLVLEANCFPPTMTH